MPAQSSIRSRLVALVIAVVLPGLAMLAWIFAEELATQHRTARDSALRIARSIAADLRDANVRADSMLERLAARPKIRVPHPSDCDSLFAIVDFFPQYLDLVLYDMHGNRLCSATPQPADLHIATEVEQIVPGFLRTNPESVPRPLVMVRDGKWVSVSFFAVRERGEQTGVLGLLQYLDIDIDAYPEGTVVTIVDSHGTILARSRDNELWSGRTGLDSDIGQVIRNAQEGQREARGIDGTVRQYGFTRVAGTDWTLYVGLPTGVAMATVRSLAFKGVLAAFVISALVAVLALRLSRSIERPLATLTDAAQRIGRIGYTEPISQEGPREVAVVADAFNRMVESRSRAERELIDSRVQLQALSNKLLEVQEQERTRIAREIHDELGQMLTAIKIDMLGLLDGIGAIPEHRAAMARRIREAIEATLTAVRRISSELRPAALDDFGLIAAIESEVRQFEERTGIECELSFDDDTIAVDRDAEAVMYRIAQEALTNVARHSNATRVEIRIREREGELLLELRDDGLGIPEAALHDPASLGIIGMRERARAVGGTIDIEGVPGRGTIVSARLPVAHAVSTT